MWGVVRVCGERSTREEGMICERWKFFFFFNLFCFFNVSPGLNICFLYYLNKLSGTIDFGRKRRERQENEGGTSSTALITARMA